MYKFDLRLSQNRCGRAVTHLHGLAQQPPALGALVKAKDGLVRVVVCQVALGN